LEKGGVRAGQPSTIVGTVREPPKNVPLLPLQHYRNGTIVYEMYIHHRPETARFDLAYARFAEPVAEVVEEACGFVWWGGSDETRAFALAGVREQGELRDGEDGAARVSDAEVHLSLIVAHDPQPRYLLGQPVGFGFAVSSGDADEQQEAVLYARDLFSRDRHGGFFDALEDYAQGR